MSLIVFGGTVLDIQAWPASGDLRRGSSVPGRVSQLAGGVGRNIAEAAHHLLQGEKQAAAAAAAAAAGPAGPAAGEGPGGGSSGVLLVSVVGRDTAADALLASFAHLGMSTAGLIRSSQAATPCVVAVLDRGREVAASVADVAAPTLELTPRVVARHAADVARARLVVLDANLLLPTLREAARAAAAAGVPVLFEPVSVPKAGRCVPILASLYAITPNASELLAIADEVQRQAGLPPLPRPQQQQQQQQEAAGGGGGSNGSQDGLLPQQLLAQLAPAAAVVLRQGLQCILLTMGHLGAAILTLGGHTSAQQQQQAGPPLLQQQHHQAAARPPAAWPGGRAAVLRACHVPAQPADVVNLSGAGDTLVGGFAAALLRGCGAARALAVGVAAARLSVQSELNVPGPGAGLVYERVQAAAAQLLAAQQHWEFPVGPGL